MNAEATNSRFAEVICAESDALCNYAKSLPDVHGAVELILNADGNVILTGLGKSGYIAEKVASTFRSLGRPAIYIHAAEASHGDLGLVQKDCVVIVISHSGESEELSDVLYYCQNYEIPLIAITAHAMSALGKMANISITYGNIAEVHETGAPMISASLALAIGDGLAVCVSEALGVVAEDFRKYHPGGKLNSELMRVVELMRIGDDIPAFTSDTSTEDLLFVISEGGLGTAILVENQTPVGVITDGDLRRNLQKIWQFRPSELVTRNPFLLKPEMLARDAAAFLNEKRITSAPVVNDKGELVGIIHLHDLIRARVV